MATSGIEFDPSAGLARHWTGFSNGGTPSRRRRLNCLLKLHNNHLSGVGDDEAGLFVLSGEFDPAAREFRWTQTYPFGGTLVFRGFVEADRIWGTWRDAEDRHGGFQIWPHAGVVSSEGARPNRTSAAPFIVPKG